MSMFFTMQFYTTKTLEGIYHVQNYVGIHRGQHHIHNESSFQKWLAQFTEEKQQDILENVKEGTCECGLTKSGQVREYDGQEWDNERFET